MPSELDVVVIKPSAGNYSVSICTSNTRLCKKCIQDVAYDAADSVRGKDLHVEVSRFRKGKGDATDVKSVVVASKEFYLGSKIANCSSHETEKNSGGYAARSEL